MFIDDGPLSLISFVDWSGGFLLRVGVVFCSPYLLSVESLGNHCILLCTLGDSISVSFYLYMHCRFIYINQEAWASNY